MGKPNLHDIFAFGDKLGSGAFATVILATENKTGKKYAMKVIEKAKAKGLESQIIKEITILKRIQHPNIIRLYECFETKEKIYMQMEYVDGGELFDRIVNLGYYGEDDAREIAKNILSAVAYLHQHNIVHRDLKPENLLMASKDEKAPVKLADFGLSTVADNDQMLKTSCGTLTYVAPEILKGEKYGKPVDLWSTGVITYILLSGYPPFYGKDDAALLDVTLSGRFQYHSPDWDSISDSAKDFIKKLIEVDPEKRSTAAQALQHPWILGEVPSEKVDLSGRVGENLIKHFNARKKLKAGLEAIKFISTVRRMSVILAMQKNGELPPLPPPPEPDQAAAGPPDSTPK